ncbi:MAG: hypothetical protein HY865_01375 [Chloroflexi bacterium]|nr:hypothetical protein [Chloroflexota bacterium]
MSLIEVAKKVDAEQYPDVVKAGNLAVAISKSLFDMGSNLVAAPTEVNEFMPYARVEVGPRFSQIHLAAGRRLFLVDFWSEGVVFGSGSSDDLADIARALHTWIAEKASIERMSSLFKFFSPTEDGKAHEAGAYVEHQWKSLLENWIAGQNPFKIRNRKQLSYFLFSLNLQQKIRYTNGYFDYLIHGNNKYSPIPLIKAAMKRPELRRLFPYTSLNSLCFSRTTGYPFTHDCPVIEPQGNRKYKVRMPRSQEVIGEGTVDEAIEMVIKHLPENCGPAVSGTADDFENP